MPEGDTLHRVARRIGDALVAHRIGSLEAPQPRHALGRIAERLKGRDVVAVDAYGKHLFLRFDGDLTLHSHLRMGGAWHVYRRGERWRRAAQRAWLVIRTDRHEVVQFDGPVLELQTDSKLRGDLRLRTLGPDILAPELDDAAVVRRLRADRGDRAIGEALLDQRIVAGIGNVWKAEGLFAAGIDPWRALERLSDTEALEIVRLTRSLMRAALARRAAMGARSARNVYRRAGRSCRVCSTTICAHGQGDRNRTTFWCPTCQR